MVDLEEFHNKMETICTESCPLGNARRKYSLAGSFSSPRTDSETVGGAARFEEGEEQIILVG